MSSNSIWQRKTSADPNKNQGLPYRESGFSILSSANELMISAYHEV